MQGVLDLVQQLLSAPGTESRYEQGAMICHRLIDHALEALLPRTARIVQTITIGAPEYKDVGMFRR